LTKNSNPSSGGSWLLHCIQFLFPLLL
jgi:hypothetical protein